VSSAKVVWGARPGEETVCSTMGGHTEGGDSAEGETVYRSGRLTIRGVIPMAENLSEYSGIFLTGASRYDTSGRGPAPG
jgi:hypothetical protein